MLENAMRICDAEFGAMIFRQGRTSAFHTSCKCTIRLRHYEELYCAREPGGMRTLGLRSVCGTVELSPSNWCMIADL